MAFKKRSSHSKPKYSISTSVAVRQGKYIKGPSFGLWDADTGPMARGSVKEGYLTELIEFLKKAEAKDLSVGFSLFKNTEKKDRDEDDDEEEEEEDDPAEKPAKKKKKPVKEEEEEEEEEKPAKKSKKKDDWDFD